MTLWIIFAAMTAGACVILLRPFKSSQNGPKATLSPSDVYKDQLAELERDVAEGRVAKTEMEAARTEISRRILDAEKSSKPIEKRQKNTLSYQKIMIALIVFVPVVTMAIYLSVGQPLLKPITMAEYKAAQAKKQPTLGDLIARVEAHLKKTPDDIKGWQVLARVYTSLGQTENAERAKANIKRIRAKTGERAGLPENDRLLMIKNMVASLHAKLKDDGSHIEGWERLIRSYIVLGQKEDALGALTEARKALAGQTDALQRLSEFSHKIGLVEKNTPKEK